MKEKGDMKVRMIHDIVNPDTGMTYKEENLAKVHQIPIGTLVEILPNEYGYEYGGVRLFIVHHHRDCDGTPLYAMSAKKSDTVLSQKGFANPSWINGFAEESLRVVETTLESGEISEDI